MTSMYTNNPLKLPYFLSFCSFFFLEREICLTGKQVSRRQREKNNTKRLHKPTKKKKERHRKPSIAKLELKRTIKETLSNKVYVKQVKRS